MQVKFLPRQTQQVLHLLEKHHLGMINREDLEAEVCLILHVAGQIPFCEKVRYNNPELGTRIAYFSAEFTDPNEDYEIFKDYIDYVTLPEWADSIVDAAERCFNTGGTRPIGDAMNRLNQRELQLA